MPNNHLAHASGTQTHWGTSEQNCKEMRKTTVAAIWPSLVILTEYEPLTSKRVFPGQMQRNSRDRAFCS